MVVSRLGLVGAALLGAAWGCAASAPTPVIGRTPTVTAKPSSSAIVARPRAVTVWTTPADSDVCTEYARGSAPEFAQFETQQSCESWVKARRCRPGFRCFDGCNYLACYADGSDTISTLMFCAVAIRTTVEFAPKSAKLGKAPDWATLLASIQSILRVRERVLHVSGFASRAEAPSDDARQRLALQRAEVVRAALVKRGADASRVIAEANRPETGQPEDQHEVRFEFLPNDVRREDLDPNSEQYRDYCQDPENRHQRPSSTRSNGERQLSAET